MKPNVEDYNRSTVDVVGDLMRQATLLVRKEGELARTEISEKVGEASTGIGLVVGGAVLLIPALVVLLGAAVTGMTDAGWSAWSAALVVGGMALLVGLLLVFLGANHLRPAELKPERTIRQLKSALNVASTSEDHDRDVQRAA